MSQIELAPITETKLADLVDLWNRAFTGAYLHGHLDEDGFREKVTGSADFDAEGSFAAMEGGRLAGGVVSYGRRSLETDNHWHTIVPGWIGAVFVEPELRRQGIGRRLLERAEDHHRRRGRLLLFAGGGEGYGHPFLGLEDDWEGARALFSRCGFRFVRRTCYVDVDLANPAEPPHVRERVEKIRSEGIWVEPARAEMAAMYARYAKEAEGEAALEKLPEDPSRMLVARTRERIIGVVSGVRGEAGGRGGFGMIQVLDEFRNRGIGTVLLAAAVSRCRRLRAVSMPLWTRPETAKRLYEKVGYRIVRNFDVYAKQLPQDLVSEEWIGRFRYV